MQQDVTRYLDELARGDAQASERLWPVVYDELRRVAAAYFQHESPHNTLQPTALVHEAYLRLVGGGRERYRNRAQFFAFAAQVMRHILVDQARRRQAIKRGGEHERVELDSGLLVRQADDGTLLDLDAALQRLEACDPQLARLVELRFFGGMTFDDVAECLGVAPITAKRLWKMAKGWLYRELGKGATDAN